MRRVRSSSEEEVIATWLKSEFEGSQRFSEDIARILDRIGLESDLLSNPNLTDSDENAKRREVLTQLRGLGMEDNLLSGFPAQVKWDLISVIPSELASILYIDWDYWLKISNGSRMPVDAAAAIRADITVYDVPNEGFLQIAEAVRAGTVFPPIIAVTNGNVGGRIVVIEGHSRLTGYALAMESIRSETEVLLGTSREFNNWWAY